MASQSSTRTSTYYRREQSLIRSVWLMIWVAVRSVSEWPMPHNGRGWRTSNWNATAAGTQSFSLDQGGLQFSLAAGGNVDWSNVDLSDIGSIEVLPGGNLSFTIGRTPTATDGNGEVASLPTNPTSSYMNGNLSSSRSGEAPMARPTRSQPLRSICRMRRRSPRPPRSFLDPPSRSTVERSMR